MRSTAYLKLALSIVVCSLLAGPAAAATTEQAKELIQTRAVHHIEEAIDMLHEHLEANPDDGDALWVMAKAHLYLGDRVEEDPLDIYKAGQGYAERAVEILPQSPHAHYWLASLMGRVGQTQGVLNSLAMVRPVQELLEKTLELDEEYADAYFVLSMLYQEAPGWPLSIGSRSKSLENAEKAVELDPDDLDFQLQLAEAHIHNRNDRQAIRVLERLLDADEIAEYPDIKDSAKELLADLTD